MKGLCYQTLASSSASSLFSLISARVLTKRVHSSALGTQICCEKKDNTFNNVSNKDQHFPESQADRYKQRIRVRRVDISPPQYHTPALVPQSLQWQSLYQSEPISHGSVLGPPPHTHWQSEPKKNNHEEIINRILVAVKSCEPIRSERSSSYYCYDLLSIYRLGGCVCWRVCMCVCAYFSIIVEVPQVQASSKVHTCKQSRVCWRPHCVIDVVTAILE